MNIKQIKQRSYQRCTRYSTQSSTPHPTASSEVVFNGQKVCAKVHQAKGGWGGTWNLQGHKKGGGGSSHPVEAEDTLRSTGYARILDLVSEGEIVGLPNGLQSIFLDGTPLMNKDGGLNFQRVSVDFRSGTQYQDYISGFPASEATEAVSVELKHGEPWVKYVTNTNLSAVRVTLDLPSGFKKISNENADVNGYYVEYTLELATDGGSYQLVQHAAFDGKTNSTYARTARIELPVATTGWQIRVNRLTPNANATNIADTTRVLDFTSVIDAKLRYPNCALIALRFDAEQFSSVPTRAYHLRGLIIAVPSNYNAETRQYAGTWDGNFKRAYTNNPAWVFFDMATNGRYGLGDKIDADTIDKYALYQIGQYCDQLVDDGFGNKEPRFTCNAYLQTAGDAYRVLTDIAGIFRAAVYWGSADPKHAYAVSVAADMPQDFVYTYTNANVIEGRFEYSGTPSSMRHTVALVSWSDLSDMGRQKVETYQYREGVERYKINKTEITAFGCTSRAQARRLGKWVTMTSCLEDQLVSFAVGLDGVVAAPGQVVRIADQHKAGRRIGGRIRSATTTEIELDAAIDVRAGDTLTVILPSGKAETRTVSSVDFKWLTADTTEWTADTTKITADMTGFPTSVSKITVSEAYSEVPEAESVWALESEELSAQTYRVLSVKENGDNTYSISAAEYVADKFAAVDHGALIDAPPITVIPPRAQPAPQNVRITNNSVVVQGAERIDASIEWDAVEFATSYEAQWRRDNSNWVAMPRTGVCSADIENVYAGGYEARVRAINAIGSTSLWANTTLTELNGTLGKPAVVTHLTTTGKVFAVTLDWGFPEGANIIQRTEVWVSASSDFASATRLGDHPYPARSYTHFGMAAGQRLYFWARLIDRNGTAGEFYPSGSGVLGTASTDATDILEYLEGKISETELAQNLVEKIEGAGSATEIKEIQDDLAAMVTIKAQLVDPNDPTKYYLAGIGIGVENTGGIIQSQVLVMADRFAVINLLDDKITSPFVIENGQVIINEAIIGKLSASHLLVNQLSELTQDAGVLVSGKLQGRNTNSYIDMNAVGNGFAVNFGNGAFTVTANGVVTMNQANVVNTLNIAGEAVASVRSQVNNNILSIDPVCSNHFEEAYVVDRNSVTVNNITGNSSIEIRAEITATITSKIGEAPSYAALQLLRDGQPIHTLQTVGGAWSFPAMEGGDGPAPTPSWFIPLMGSSFSFEERLSARAQATYTFRILLWHKRRHYRVYLNVWNSTLQVRVQRK